MFLRSMRFILSFLLLSFVLTNSAAADYVNLELAWELDGLSSPELMSMATSSSISVVYSVRP